MDWMPCNPINQYYISELKHCKDKPYLVTYRTLKGRLYVTKVNIKNGRIQGKVGGDVLAWMPLPQPYTADRKTENGSEKPNNCEPQTNADQHVQHVGSVETMSCEECKHWIFTSRWGYFCPLKGKDECNYEPIETEPQTDCPWK